MNIYVAGHKAELKQSFSFEYVVENPLFGGRDGYTFEIEFPLRGSQRNLDIFGWLCRPDVTPEKVSFDAQIVADGVSLFGSLLVTGLSSVSVKCQFAEGRCEHSAVDPFEDRYINTLRLGSVSDELTDPRNVPVFEAWIGHAGIIAAPWINAEYPEAPNNWVILNENNEFTWHPDVKALSWQITLLEITRQICKAIDFTYDFSEWPSSLADLYVMNSLPASWGAYNFADVLPHWTVSEFFEHLGLFLSGEFMIDRRTKHIVFHKFENLLRDAGVVKLPDVVDEFDGEVSAEDDAPADFKSSRRLCYASPGYDTWPLLACDWYFRTPPEVVRYDTLSELLNRNAKRVLTEPGYREEIPTWGEYIQLGGNRPVSTVGRILYAADVDTCFAWKVVGLEYYVSDQHGHRRPYNKYTLQPINVFGSTIPESDNVESDEIQFVPVQLTDTYVSDSDDMGVMMQLSPPEFTADNGSALSDDEEIEQPAVTRQILAGDIGDKSANTYNNIFVAAWPGFHPQRPGFPPFPIVDKVFITDNWQAVQSDFSALRLSDDAHATQSLPTIDSKRKMRFSWLADEMPPAMAVFVIRGKRYVCEKITATFTETGMSQLLKGEFYPLLDD